MRFTKLHALSFVIAGLAVSNGVKAQLFIDQAQFTIQPGATVTVQGDVTSNVDILGTGKIILKGSAAQNVNMGGFNVPNLEVDNAANINLTGNAKVSGDLLFTTGQVLLANNNLTMGSAGTITGAGATKFVVTNGTGKLVKASLGNTAFAYPVGRAVGNYNPVSIANSGTADDIGVRAFASVLTAGTTGTAYTKEVVNNSWDVTEATAGGSNLSVTTTWNGTDELPGFDRTRGGVSQYVSSPAGWDLLVSQTSAATGTNPYSVTRTGITNAGVIAVGTRSLMAPLLVSPKVFLQGAYNSTTGVMSESLRTNNLIPATEPYSGTTVLSAPYITAALRGSGGGETADATVIGSGAASSNNSIVDWVVVQLHRTTDNVVISQRAALLQRDGDVVDVDGTSPVNMAGNPSGNYFVSVRHRNHIGVRTAQALALSRVATSYNFTTAQSQAFTGTVTNNPMATVGTSFAMWGGNANGNTNVRYSGPGNDESQLLNTCLSGNKASVLSGYLNCDLNLNGQLKYSGPGNDESVLLNTILGGNKSTVITQPTF
jgi:hypothetical protein